MFMIVLLSMLELFLIMVMLFQCFTFVMLRFIMRISNNKNIVLAFIIDNRASRHSTHSCIFQTYQCSDAHAVDEPLFIALHSRMYCHCFCTWLKSVTYSIYIRVILLAWIIGKRKVNRLTN